jgi:hypothetical protein
MAVERAAGHPLILEHLLAAPGAEVMPGTVRTVVLARIDALAPTDRQALLCASVLGIRFDLEDLRGVIDDEHYTPTALLAQDLLRRDGAWLDFAHALVRDVAYRALLRPQRAVLHRRAAAQVAHADLALHAHHLGRAGEPGAPNAYLAAARAEAETHHPDAALDLANRGLELADKHAERAALTTVRADALLLLGKSKGALVAFESARALATDDASKFAAAMGIAAALRLADRTPEARAPIQEAEDLARAMDSLELLSQVLHLKGNVLFMLGDMERCAQAHHAALDAARAAGSTIAEAHALGGLADLAYLRGDIRGGLKTTTRCVAAARAQDLVWLEAANWPLLAAFLVFNARVDEGHEQARLSFEHARAVGHHRAVSLAAQMLALTSMYTADPNEDLDFVQIGIDAARAIGAPIRMADMNTMRAMLTHHADGSTAPESEVRAALAVYRERGGMAFTGPNILSTLATFTTDMAERRALLAEGEALLQAGRAPHNHVLFADYAIDLALRDRNYDEVVRLADQLRGYDAPLGALIADTAVAAVARSTGATGWPDQVEDVRARIVASGARRLLNWLEDPGHALT